MFDVLVASNRKRRRDVSGTIGGLFFSTAFQAAIMVGAVYATMQVPDEMHEVDMDTIDFILPEPEQEEQPDEPPQPVITSLNPPPKGFLVLIPPVEIPTEIPTPDLSQRFDARDYTWVGDEDGVFSGVPGGTGPVDLVQVFQVAVVDEPPKQLSCPTPQYPRMMQQANIEGEVLLQFVVERDGHVMRQTIETMSVTHRAFEGPARDMIQRCLFRPGKVGVSSVRVLVQMRIVFELYQR